MIDGTVCACLNVPQALDKFRGQQIHQITKGEKFLLGKKKSAEILICHYLSSLT